MALREIRTFDDTFLHKHSRPVAEVDDRIRTLLGDMAETMYHTQNGGGLAACQVGVLRRVIVADMGDGLLQLVNPRIISATGEQLVVEGCLSYPGRWAHVRRPQTVRVEALNENGAPVTIVAADALAKCLCHEIDHLDGIVLADRAIDYVSLP
ncbi:MAG: peptide deformylase [Clostridiales bacterium]|nr:peptide deformylase [Clostridiales bacterium]